MSAARLVLTIKAVGFMRPTVSRVYEQFTALLALPRFEILHMARRGTLQTNI
jgi:hypothetical protein